MCGIFGGQPELLRNDAMKLLRHRGPDQEGVLDLRDRAGKPFVFGMTRLNVVDRHNTEVPYEAGGAAIVFNGEIYNWRELRAELQQHGIAFRTDTDTEVVLHAYLKWGPDCLDRFNGMFAIAIWKDGELFLARDRLGIKPLFYWDGGGTAFASEIKAFAKLRPEKTDICERLEFYFDDHTPFQNIRSVKPGEYIVIDTSDGARRSTTWWRFPPYDGSISEMDSALDAFLPLFEDACRIRAQADVPVTVFLSGGLDSSLIQAILKLDKTYTVQFAELRDIVDEESNVEEFAGAIGFDANFVRPTKEQLLDLLPEICWHLEQKVGTSSVFPNYLLAREARRNGFVVALTGQGADELFNGYARNEMLLAENAVVEQYETGPYAPMAGRHFGPALARFTRMYNRGTPDDIPVLQAFFQSRWSSGAPFAHNLAVIETSVVLQSFLTMDDRMSMAHGVETRSPFFDHRIIEFSVCVEPTLRLDAGEGKPLLRQALKAVLGRDDLGVVQPRPKHGLMTPINGWLFERDDFDRREWNQLVASTCQRALTDESSGGFSLKKPRAGDDPGLRRQGLKH